VFRVLGTGDRFKVELNWSGTDGQESRGCRGDFNSAGVRAVVTRRGLCDLPGSPPKAERWVIVQFNSEGKVSMYDL
jgi:hypothetical protein